MTILKKSASASVADDSATLTADEVHRLRVFLQAVGHLTATGTRYTMANRPAEYAGMPKVWRTVIKMIPGAVQLRTAEGKPSRFWSVSHDAYQRWLNAQEPAPLQDPARPWSPEDCLIGLRMLGGSK